MQTCAANEANFRIPDRQGWQPKEESISKKDPYKAVKITKLPVDQIAGKNM